ncbi:DNA primase regulatory subunit PriL [Sulfurisphaera javensis]|uniref:DNA primase large subunit PriL n=1 Tax=Sulfurisphaera javensis TaxID=2049879 RepID=A0AAT9GUI1_9CREN
MELPILDFRKYPFLKPLEDELKKYAGGVTLNDLLSSENYYLEQAKQRIDKILKDQDLEPYDKLKDSVLVFYTTLFLVAALDSEILKRKFLDKETEIIEKNLLDEDEDTLLEISKLIGLKIEKDKLELKYKENKKTLTKYLNFSVDFLNYLKYSKELRKKDNNFSLSTHILKSGKVYLNKEEIVKILVFQIKDRLYEMMNITDVTLPEQIKKFADEMRGRKTPPCISELLKKGNFNEEDLKILTTYYIDIGDERSALNLVKDENAIKRLKGDKKTKYIVYSCKKMKDLGYCVASCNVINPLQLYYGRLE